MGSIAAHDPTTEHGTRTSRGDCRQPADTRALDETGGRAVPKVGRGPRARLTPAAVLSLQRTAGNSALAHVMASRPTAVQRCRGGGCCADCAQDDLPGSQVGAPPVQRELVADATRTIEPGPSGGAGSAGSGAGEPGRGAATARPTAAPQGAERASEPSHVEGAPAELSGAIAQAPQGAAPAEAVPAGSAPAEVAPAEIAPDEALGEAAPAPAEERPAPGGGVDAACYSESAEEPDEEPDDEPPEPETTDAEEQVESESPDAEENDDCPIGDAIDTAAPQPAGGSPLGGAVDPPSADSGEQGTHAEAAGEPTAGAAGAHDAPSAGGAGATAAQSEAHAAARAPLDGAIATVEASRDQAVGAYSTSKASLAALAGARTAAGGDVVFGDERRPSAAASARRQAAQARAAAFFIDGSERVAGAVTLGLETVPDRLGQKANSLKAELGASVDAQQTAISARIQGARDEAATRAGEARQQVAADHASSVAIIESETATAIDTLSATHAASMASIDDRETEALDGINATYATSRVAHEALGPVLGERAVARGEEYADQYEGCKIHERDSFWAGYLTDRRAEAQQKAARETAKGYAKNIADTAKKQAREATKGRSKDRCGVIAAAGRARDTADEQLHALQGSLDAARVEAIAQADSMLAQVTSAIDGALDATLSALDRQEHDQRQAASDTGYLQQLLIEQIAHSSASGLQVAIGQAVLTISDVFDQLRATFATSPAPDADALTALLGRASAALGGGVTAVITQIEAGAGTAGDLLDNAGAHAFAALDGVTATSDEQAAAQATSLAETLGSLGSNATATFGQQTDTFVSQAQSTAAQGATGLEQVATGFDQTCGTIAEQVAAALADSEQKLSESLLQSLTGLDSRSDGIPKQAHEAASHEQPAWKSIAKWVLIIAIVIVVALVIGPAVIGAVGAAAATLGAGAAAGTIGTLVGGAIVGAATSATIQVVNNVADGRTWHQGIGRAAIMGAIGGAFGAGAGALIGKYVATTAFQFASNVAADALLEVGTQLVTGEFSWEALGMSVMMSVATGGFGEVGAVKGIQQRFMSAGAGMVPGSGARAYADSIRPSTGPQEPGGGRPSSSEAPGAPSRAAPETEAEVTGPRAGETEAGAEARTEPASGAPTGTRGAGEVETSTRVGDTDHHVSVRQRPGGTEVWVCSGACGPLKARIDDILPHVSPDSPAHAQLQELRIEAESLEARIDRGEIPDQVEQRAAVDTLGERLTEIGRQEPDIGRLLDVSGTTGEPATPLGAGDSARLPPGVRSGPRRQRALEILDALPAPQRQEIMSRLNQMSPERAGELLTRLGHVESPDDLVRALETFRSGSEPEPGELDRRGIDPEDIEGRHVVENRPNRVDPETIGAGRGALKGRMEPPDWAGGPGDWNPHHVIPVQLENHPVFDVLRNNGGWDHNAAANGFALPTRPGIEGAEHLPVHQMEGGIDVRGHPIWNENVRTRLDELEPFLGDPVTLRAKVDSLIADLHRDLLGRVARGLPVLF